MTTHEPEPAGVIPDAAIEAAWRGGQLAAKNFDMADLEPMDDEARECLRAALLAAQPFMVGDAVAWRWRWKDHGPDETWNLVTSELRLGSNVDIEPLYARPVLSSASEAGKAEGAPLLELVRDAVLDTAARPPGLRGPYVFDEAELQATAAKFASPPPEECKRGNLIERTSSEAVKSLCHLHEELLRKASSEAHIVVLHGGDLMRMAGTILDGAIAVERAERAALASNDAREMASALDLFREFVLHNATQWKLGAGHHHPIWQLVAELLPPSAGRNMSGERWQFIQPDNTETLAALSRRHPAPDGGAK